VLPVHKTETLFWNPVTHSNMYQAVLLHHALLTATAEEW